MKLIYLPCEMNSKYYNGHEIPNKVQATLPSLNSLQAPRTHSSSIIMAFNQVVLPYDFPFSYAHRNACLPKPIPPWLQQQPTNFDTYLKEQDELAKPSTGPNRSLQPELDEDEVHGWERVFISISSNFQTGARSAINSLLRGLRAASYLLLQRPFSLLCEFLASLDWSLVLACLLVVIFAPVLANLKGHTKDEVVRTVPGDVEYVLVRQYRRWGKSNTNSHRKPCTDMS
jgi:hypothetical protein